MSSSTKPFKHITENKVPASVSENPVLPPSPTSKKPSPSLPSPKMTESPQPGQTSGKVVTSSAIKHGSSVISETSSVSSSSSKWTVVESGDSADGISWSKQSYSLKSDKKSSENVVNSVTGVSVTSGELTGDLNLDMVGRSSKKLTHPTTTRAKAPKRRPPSTLITKEDFKNGDKEYDDEEESPEDPLVNGDAESHVEKPSNAPPWLEELKLSQAEKSFQNSMQGKTSRVVIGMQSSTSERSISEKTVSERTIVEKSSGKAVTEKSERAVSEKVISEKAISPESKAALVTLRQQPIVGQNPQSMVKEYDDEEESPEDPLVNGDVESHVGKPSNAPPWLEELKLSKAKKSFQNSMEVTLRQQPIVGQRPQSMMASFKASTSPPLYPTLSSESITISQKQWNDLLEKDLKNGDKEYDDKEESPEDPLVNGDVESHVEKPSNDPPWLAELKLSKAKKSFRNSTQGKTSRVVEGMHSSASERSISENTVSERTIVEKSSDKAVTEKSERAVSEKLISEKAISPESKAALVTLRQQPIVGQNLQSMTKEYDDEKESPSLVNGDVESHVGKPSNALPWLEELKLSKATKSFQNSMEDKTSRVVEGMHSSTSERSISEKTVSERTIVEKSSDKAVTEKSGKAGSEKFISEKDISPKSKATLVTLRQQLIVGPPLHPTLSSESITISQKEWNNLHEKDLRNGDKQYDHKEESPEDPLVNGDVESHVEKPSNDPPWLAELKLSKAKKSFRNSTQGKTSSMVIGMQSSKSERSISEETVSERTIVEKSSDKAVTEKSEKAVSEKLISEKAISPESKAALVTLRQQPIVGQRPQSMMASFKASTSPPLYRTLSSESITISQKQWNDLHEKENFKNGDKEYDDEEESPEEPLVNGDVESHVGKPSNAPPWLEEHKLSKAKKSYQNSMEDKTSRVVEGMHSSTSERSISEKTVSERTIVEKSSDKAVTEKSEKAGSEKFISEKAISPESKAALVSLRQQPIVGPPLHPTLSSESITISQKQWNDLHEKENFKNGDKEYDDEEESPEEPLVNGDVESHVWKPSNAPPWLEEHKLSKAKKSYQNSMEGKTNRVVIGMQSSTSGKSISENTVSERTIVEKSSDKAVTEKSEKAVSEKVISEKAISPESKAALVTLRQQPIVGPLLHPTLSSESITISQKQWNDLLEKVSLLEANFEAQIGALTKAVKDLIGKLDDERQRKMVMKKELD